MEFDEVILLFEDSFLVNRKTLDTPNYFHIEIGTLLGLFFQIAFGSKW
jgi:hypothetical protein